MSVNFLIFLVNAFVVPSASIRTRTQDLLGIPAQPPWHRIDTVLAEQWLMVWQPQRGFVHQEVLCVTQGSAGHPGMCHHPQDMEVLPQMPAWLCLATGNADTVGLHAQHRDRSHAKLSNCCCHPLWPRSPQGQRGGRPCVPPRKGGSAGCLHSRAGSAAAGRGAQMRCGRRVTSH